MTPNLVGMSVFATQPYIHATVTHISWTLIVNNMAVKQFIRDAVTCKKQ